jgi:hypothetical protein
VKHTISYCAIAAALVVAGLGSPTKMSGQQGAGSVAIDSDDIGGVVTSAKGPEAGVWVIAETKETPTKFTRIVVTNDNGQYVLPDLPKVSFDVWVRGYGLVDSPKVKAQPGKTLNLTATVAPSARAAADYYPANYWLALLQPPPKSDFPGTGLNGNGFPETLKTQAMWIGNMKMTNACTQCHQLGNKPTREISPALGTFKNSVDAWSYRVEVGVSGAFMGGTLGPLGRRRTLDVLADWTDRIAKGEVPQAPPRPQGVERNIVVTLWDWADAKTFVHDEIATDRRNPTVNAYGPVYGTQELSGDWVTMLDPVKNEARRKVLPLNDDKMPYAWAQSQPNPSPYWGDEIIWKSRVDPHNPMIDGKGRLWVTAHGGCRLYEPKLDKVTALGPCPGSHHLQLDANDVLWFDAGGAAYFDTRVWDKTGDAEKASGRIPVVVDYNGNGKLDENPAPGDKPDPARDLAPKLGGSYSVVANYADGSVWLSYNQVPGSIVRVDPKTKLSEVYEPPFMNSRAKVEGYEPHGIDVDSRGVMWTGLNSGHLASFDRRKCKAPYNPRAEPLGQQCTEGWTLYQAPGPNFKGVTESGSADSFYSNWTDQFDTFGLGKDVPIVTGSGSDSLLAYVNGRWVTLRVPYPLGFHPRGLDGRIDDPKAGWKGRGLWSAYAEQATWHIEGGRGTLPKVVHFQLRPDPLAH